jgi:hypothetical protein
MPTARRRILAWSSVLLVAPALAPPAASADRSCGVTGRPFTDGGAEVTIRKGSLRCTTARSVMRRYWRTRVDAFTRTVRVRVAGIRWTCRPTVDDFPYRWACTGGGPARDRFRITARE